MLTVEKIRILAIIITFIDGQNSAALLICRFDNKRKIRQKLNAEPSSNI